MVGGVHAGGAGNKVGPGQISCERGKIKADLTLELCGYSNKMMMSNPIKHAQAKFRIFTIQAIGMTSNFLKRVWSNTAVIPGTHSAVISTLGS